jgi:hypothetical protein
MQLFEMSQITIKALESKLIAYHGLFKQNKCEAKEMEELVSSALDSDPIYNGSVIWKSGSHDPGSDIMINNIKLSIKSGSIKKDIITISGNRLTGAKGDFNVINSLLKSYTSDVMICFVYNKENSKYQVIYVDSNVFVYPDSVKSWIPIMGKKNGSISSYSYNSPVDMQVKIIPAMSWQAWWYIPLRVCRIGVDISTRT